jgi:hypothetical protein
MHADKRHIRRAFSHAYHLLVRRSTPFHRLYFFPLLPKSRRNKPKTAETEKT